MEMIVISKAQFYALFQACFDKLSLETLKQAKYMGSHSQDFNDLHRKFHYEITELRDQLEKT